MFILPIFLISSIANSAEVDCGTVDILQILSGPKYGSMMKVSNSNCGPKEGWVCLDPGAEHMSQEESQRLYSLVLASKMSGQKLSVKIIDSLNAEACGGTFPIAYDVRTNF